jgi:hypothetical protein
MSKAAGFLVQMYVKAGLHYIIQGQIVNGLYKKHKSCGRSAFADFIYVFCKVCQLSFVPMIPIEYHRKNIARVYAG